MGDITQLLDQVRAGKPGARDALLSRIYGDLRNLARAKLYGSQPITLLDTAVLIQETYLRLIERDALPPAENRSRFFAYAASIMRSVIIDLLREKQAAKRGGGEARLTLQTHDVGAQARDPDLEALDDALRDLQKIDERCCQIVEMRYFAGLSVEEVAEALELSVSTVEREWRKARGFLYRALRET
jgi:RNA polymerase sigma factor (TIGR02999 family)